MTSISTVVFLVLLSSASVVAANSEEGSLDAFPWFDVTLPRSARVSALVKSMTLEEKIAQLVVDTPEVPRLGLPSYHW